MRCGRFFRSYIVVGKLETESIKLNKLFIIIEARIGAAPAFSASHITVEISPADSDGRDIQLKSIKSRVVSPHPKPHSFLLANAVPMHCKTCCVSHSIILLPLHSIIVGRRRRGCWKLKFIQTNYVTASDLHRTARHAIPFLDTFIL